MYRGPLPLAHDSGLHTAAARPAFGVRPVLPVLSAPTARVTAPGCPTEPGRACAMLAGRATIARRRFLPRHPRRPKALTEAQWQLASSPVRGLSALAPSLKCSHWPVARKGLLSHLSVPSFNAGVIIASIAGIVVFVRFFRGGPAVASVLRKAASLAESGGGGGTSAGLRLLSQPPVSKGSGTMSGSAAAARLGSSYNAVGSADL